MATALPAKRSVRVARFEVAKIHGDAKATFARWFTLMQQCQRVYNVAMRTWLLWHVQNGSIETLKKHFAEFEEWSKADPKTRGTKPKWGVKDWTPVLGKAVYAACAKEVDGLNLRPLTLLLDVIRKKIGSLPSSKGSGRGWYRVLLGLQRLPAADDELPIPFDAKATEKNQGIIAPAKDGGNFRLKLRLDRVRRDGKVSTSTLDDFELRTKPRGGQTEILWKIKAGEYKFCGSQLLYRGGKWFAGICYQRPTEEHSGLDASNVAVLSPGLTTPWRIRFRKERTDRWIVGAGRHVSSVRNNLLTQRWSRQQNYRHAASSTKGHGRKRALVPVEKFAQRWKDFVKTLNHTMTKRLVDKCLARKVGKIVYLQPTGRKRDTRFLATAGKIEGRRDSTNWDWSQVASMLAAKCKHVGIELEIRKLGGETEEHEAA